MSAPAPPMFSPAARAAAERIGLVMGRANLEEFAESLTALAKENRQIVVVTSDSRGSGKLGPFGQALPDQLVEVGIAEQNLVGITAGLAAAGKKSFGVSPACFLTARALEQVKNDVCYSDVPAVVVSWVPDCVHPPWPEDTCSICRVESAPVVVMTPLEKSTPETVPVAEICPMGAIAWP